MSPSCRRFVLAADAQSVLPATGPRNAPLGGQIMRSGVLVWGHHPQHLPRSLQSEQWSSHGLRQDGSCVGGRVCQGRQELSGGARAWHGVTAQHASQHAQTAKSAVTSQRHNLDQSGGQRSQGSPDDASIVALRPDAHGSELRQIGHQRAQAQAAGASRAAASDVPKLEMLSQQDFGRWAVFCTVCTPFCLMTTLHILTSCRFGFAELAVLPFAGQL